MLRECNVSVGDNGCITVPAGYITDLASVPRAAWAFISPFGVAGAGGEAGGGFGGVGPEG